MIYNLINKKDVSVAVHGGDIFHPDELLYIALLRLIYGDSHVTYERVSREERNFSRFDYIADVGGRCCEITDDKGHLLKVYHDHHGENCAEYREYNIRRNSFGMLCEMVFPDNFLKVFKREILNAVEIMDNMQVFGSGEECHHLEGRINNPYEFVFTEEKTVFDALSADYYFARALTHVEMYLLKDIKVIESALKTGTADSLHIPMHAPNPEDVARFKSAVSYVQMDLTKRLHDSSTFHNGVIIADPVYGVCRNIWDPCIERLRREGIKVNYLVFEQYKGRAVLYSCDEGHDFPQSWIAMEDDHKILNGIPIRFCHTARNILVTDTLEDAESLAALA